MTTIHFTAILSLIVIILLGKTVKNLIPKRDKKDAKAELQIITGIFAFAFILRLLFAYYTKGNKTDLNCFYAWACRVFELGPKGFYSPDVFTDYPPGYIYILYPIGFILKTFNVTYFSNFCLTLLKLPSIICDIIAGGIIYTQSRKKLNFPASSLLSVLYIFNPCVLLNSSIWGQVDSILALFVLLTCVAVSKDRMPLSYFIFIVGVLIKPQMLIFAPVIIAGILDHVILDNFSAKKFFVNLAYGLCSIALFFLAALPFGLTNVLSQYTDTLGSYPYATVNAYNIYGLFGQNWVGQDTTFLGIAYKTWGTIAIVVITLLSIALSLYLRKKEGMSECKYPLIAAFVIFSVFTFSVRMHERYLFPGLICLILVLIDRPIKHMFNLYSLATCFSFYNTAHILYFYDPSTYDTRSATVRFVSFGMVCVTLYFVYVILKEFVQVVGVCESVALVNSKQHGGKNKNYKEADGISLTKKFNKLMRDGLPPKASAPVIKMTGLDIALLLVIVIVYSGFALFDLGDKKAPETVHTMSEGESVYFKFDQDNLPKHISTYVGPIPWADTKFALWEKNEYTDWTFIDDITNNRVFTWSTSDLPMADGMNEIWLGIHGDKDAYIFEMVFTDDYNNIITPLNASDYPELFDEQMLLPDRSSFRNSMYFDEIYHARTAYEYIHGLVTYENTHPPLGKIFIMIGVLIFGMNPFGWRIIGTLFGIMMLPFIYVFAKKFTENTPAAAFACTLFAFDFMHFAQTRIATIDVYITFFVIVMYFFMYWYSTLSFYDTPLKKTYIPLGACGISMGLGVASKWTGVYSGIGLAVIFSAVMFRRYLEYRYALNTPKANTDGIKHKDITASFNKNFFGTIKFCMIFFVLIPVIIYTLSYIPFRTYDPNESLLSRMLNNQSSMLSYHSGLNATHPYSSTWYEWPIMKRPIWYFSGILEGSMREGISSFGNPLVWWTGILAFAVMIFLIIKKADKKAMFLTVGILAQYLPWVLVTRVTFIYHFFPSVPFIVLMITHCTMQIKPKIKNSHFVAALMVYGLCVFGLFILFYPVLAGQPISAGFVDKFLRWGKDWVLVSGS